MSAAARALPASPEIHPEPMGSPDVPARPSPDSGCRLSQKIYRTSCPFIEHKDGRSIGGTKKTGKPPSQAGPPRQSHFQKNEPAPAGQEKNAPQPAPPGVSLIMDFSPPTRLFIFFT